MLNPGLLLALPLVTGEQVAAVAVLGLPFLLVFLLWRQFRRRKDKRVDEYS